VGGPLRQDVGGQCTGDARVALVGGRHRGGGGAAPGRRGGGRGAVGDEHDLGLRGRRGDRRRRSRAGGGGVDAERGAGQDGDHGERGEGDSAVHLAFDGRR